LHIFPPANLLNDKNSKSNHFNKSGRPIFARVGKVIKSGRPVTGLKVCSNKTLVPKKQQTSALVFENCIKWGLHLFNGFIKYAERIFSPSSPAKSPSKFNFTTVRW